MTDRENMVPIIRFKGFTDDWEKSKLGDVVERITRKNSNLESERPLTISAQYGIIDQNDFFGKQIASKDVRGYFLLKYGDFAYNKSYSNGYPWGAVKRLDKYNMGVLSTLYIVFKPIYVESEFLAQYYETSNWYMEVAIRSAEGARNHGLLNITPIDFFETILKFPKEVNEQIAIGNFFCTIDEVITLYQRKLDGLKKLKKGYLQQIFPKTDECVPRVRFDGFDEPWEKNDLSALADRYDNLRVPITASERIPGNTPYYGANGIQDYVEGFTHDGEFILVAEDGANNLQDYSIQYVSGKVWVNNHTHVLQAKKDISDNKFLMNAMRNTNIEPYLVGSGRSKLNANVMMKITFRTPSKSEQILIGSFFYNIDEQINNYNKKLNQLKKLKAAYLQKMFI